MRQRTRLIFRVLLAMLLLVAGRTVDLCACDGSSHGPLCADETAGHCGPVASAPVEVASSCCQATDRATDRAEPRPPGPQLAAAQCGCPELELALSPAEVLTRVAHVAGALAPALPHAALAALTSAELDARPVRWDAGPPRARWSALRRHLELHVLRC